MSDNLYIISFSISESIYRCQMISAAEVGRHSDVIPKKNSKTTHGLKNPVTDLSWYSYVTLLIDLSPQKWVPLYFRNHLVVCRKLMCLFIIILFTIWAITGLPILRMYTRLHNNKYTILFAHQFLPLHSMFYRVKEPLSHEETRVRIGPQYSFLVSNGD